MNNKLSFFISRLLITIIVTLSILIMCKKNDDFKNKFREYVYDTNFKFASFNEYYKKYFGNLIPFFDSSNDDLVFSEKINYNSLTPYLDGVSLDVGSDYLVPSLRSGLVIFIGNKDGYGDTVIIEDSNGIDIWYSNIKNINVSLYQYVSQGEMVGEVVDNLYLVFKKDGNVCDYQKYLY